MKYIPNFTKLKHTLSFVWYNSYSSFYRKKYTAVGINPENLMYQEEFEKFPFLTKKELEDVSPDKRLFIDPKDVYFTAYTSGTTTQKPLALYFTQIHNYFFEPSLGLDISSPLIIYPPLNKNFGHTFIQQCRQAKHPVMPIFADFQNLANSAVIARELKADAIYATPTIAILLADHMERYYDPTKIKLLALGSETLTSTGRQTLLQRYPHAKIANLYASSEIGQFILYPCFSMIHEGRDAFHVLNQAIDCLELIDNELVITYSLNKAIPLIRYKTGDYFREEKDKCSCGVPGPVLSWMGRLNVDRIRTGGVEIMIDSVEQAFSHIRHLIGDQYQIHFYSTILKNKEIIKTVIEVLDSYPFGNKNRDVLVSEIMRILPDVWRISPSVTFRHAIEQGFFMDPEIHFVKEFSDKSIKMKKMVSHL